MEAAIGLRLELSRGCTGWSLGVGHINAGVGLGFAWQAGGELQFPLTLTHPHSPSLTLTHSPSPMQELGTDKQSARAKLDAIHQAWDEQKRPQN